MLRRPKHSKIEVVAPEEEEVEGGGGEEEVWKSSFQNDRNFARYLDVQNSQLNAVRVADRKRRGSKLNGSGGFLNFS